MITLEVINREKGKAGNLQKEGLMPGVFYGKKEKSTPISVKINDFLKVWKEAGESTVIVLKGEGGDREALVHEVQIDPVKGIPRHADFYVFEKGHKVEVAVPLEFIGLAPAVKEQGGTLVKVLHELNIEAMPKDLPHDIKADVSSLVDFKSQILAKDLSLPEGVILKEKPEEVVALVEEMKEIVEEEVAPVDLSEIEVEKKGKKDDDEETEESETKAQTQKQEKGSSEQSK